MRVEDVVDADDDDAAAVGVDMGIEPSVPAAVSAAL